MNEQDLPKVIEFRNPDQPWPDNPEIHGLQPFDPSELDDDFDDFEPPSDEDIDEENTLMLRRQRLFRWAAQAIAVAFSGMPEVEKVAAFGAVAQPLTEEVPRFRQFRRRGIEILHECGDLDLAVWLTSLDKLKELKNTRCRRDCRPYKTRRMAEWRTIRWMSISSIHGPEIIAEDCASLGSVLSRGSVSAWYQAVARASSCNSLPNIVSTALSSKASRR